MQISQKENEVRSLCLQGVHYRDAALQAGVSHSTAYNYDLARRKGHKSYRDYKICLFQKQLARGELKEATSFSEYNRICNSKLSGSSESGYKRDERGIKIPKTKKEEIRRLARRMKKVDGNVSFVNISHQTGVPYNIAWRYAKPIEQGSPLKPSYYKGSREEQYEYIRGYRARKSLRLFLRKELTKLYRKNVSDIRLLMTTLVKSRLKDLGKKQIKLCQETNLTESGISRILLGKRMPRNKTQKVVFNSLNLPFESLDEFVMNICESVVNSYEFSGLTMHDTKDRQFYLYNCKLCGTSRAKEDTLDHYLEEHSQFYLFS